MLSSNIWVFAILLSFLVLKMGICNYQTILDFKIRSHQTRPLAMVVWLLAFHYCLWTEIESSWWNQITVSVGKCQFFQLMWETKWYLSPWSVFRYLHRERGDTRSKPYMCSLLHRADHRNLTGKGCWFLMGKGLAAWQSCMKNMITIYSFHLWHKIICFMISYEF